MTYQPQPGHFLHASCSAEDVYEIIGAGADANGAPTIDVRVIDVNEIIHYEHDNDAKGDGSDEKWFAPLTTAELPAGVHLILRGLQWRQVPAGYDDVVRIVVNGPVGGCYRCCYLFGVYAAPGGDKPVRDRKGEG